MFGIERWLVNVLNLCFLGFFLEILCISFFTITFVLVFSVFLLSFNLKIEITLAPFTVNLSRLYNVM